MTEELKRGKRQSEPRIDPAKLDRLPPHSEEAEAGVLGCALLEPKRVIDAAREQGLAASWFYDMRHQSIWSAMESLDQARQPVDMISVCQKLKDTDLLEQVGGYSYVMALPNNVPSAANVAYYLKLVKEKWQLRRLLATLTACSESIWDWTGSVDQLMDEIANDVDVASSQGTVKRERKLCEIMPEVVDDMEEFHRGRSKLRGLGTGFTYWDKVLQGIRHESYFVIAARPGDGKTAMALNLVRFLSTEYVWWQRTNAQEPAAEPQFESRTGIPVGVFSLEMGDKSLGERLLFCESRVSAGKWNQGFLSDGDVPKLAGACEKLKRAPVWVDESESLTIAEVRSRARRMKRELGIKCFFLDYLQLVKGYAGKRYRDDVERLNDISEGLRVLVKELQVPFIVLAQMNRDIEKSEASRVPMLGDLKGCGQIEQDAAQIAFLFRPSSKMLAEKVKTENGWEEVNARDLIKNTYGENGLNLDQTQHPVRLDCWMAKNRGGPTGWVKLLFQRDFVRFEDWNEWLINRGLKEPAAGERGKVNQEEML